MQCVVCAKRPARAGTKFCWQCTQDAKAIAPEKAPSIWNGVKYVVLWHGEVMAFREIDQLDEYGDRMFTGVYMGQASLKGLPKEVSVLDISHWIPGFSEQIKKLKAAFRQCAPKMKHVYKDGSSRMVPMLHKGA